MTPEDPPYYPVNIAPPPMKPPRAESVSEDDIDNSINVYTAKQIIPSPEGADDLAREITRARKLADKFDRKVNGYTSWIAGTIVFAIIIPGIIAVGAVASWLLLKLF